MNSSCWQYSMPISLFKIIITCVVRRCAPMVNVWMNCKRQIPWLTSLDKSLLIISWESVCNSWMNPDSKIFSRICTWKLHVLCSHFMSICIIYTSSYSSQAQSWVMLWLKIVLCATPLNIGWIKMRSFYWVESMGVIPYICLHLYDSFKKVWF